MPELLSVAVTVKLKVPPAVGVPDNMPLDPSVKPVGKAPEVTAYPYGAMPPEAVTVLLYAVPTLAAGRLPGLREMVGALTVNVYT